MDAQLLKTKLYIPSLRPGWVSRARLIKRLNEGLRPECKLTLLSAPAGFGKTTLLSEWIAGCAPSTRIAWISLDQQDNDLTRFLTYLGAAVRTLKPELRQNVLGQAQPSQLPDTEAILTGLINDLADCHDPIVLVLDDGHEITADAVHSALIFLLDHLPPHAHIVVATRVDPPWPLALLRSRQDMIELRTQDLRFTLEEAAIFLNDAMGFTLSTRDIAALDARTEGWIAGLQMAALSMRGREDTKPFIQAFSGNHRFVLDYLVEEVLEQQDDAIQTFLLQTSILDHLTASLCDAVVQRDGIADSQATLDHLDRTNLFVVPLDDERRWYRYHHLFTDLLRKRFESLYPEQVTECNMRASAWHERQGSIHEAVMYAQAAGDDARVLSLVEQYCGQALRRGELVHVSRWLDALPKALVRSRPLLCLARAWSLIGDPVSRDRAVSWLERGLTLSAANPRPVRDLDNMTRTDYEIITHNAFLFRINLATAQHKEPEAVIDLCLDALKALPKEAAFERGGVTFYLAQAYRQVHNNQAAAQTFAQAKQMGQATEGHIIALSATGMQAVDAWEREDLHAVASMCRDAMTSLVYPIEQAGQRIPPHACLVYVLLGRTLVAWNELAEAKPLLIQGMELAERAQEPGIQVDCSCDLARLHWTQGDFQEAHAWMDRALQACRWDPGYLHALRVRIWLAQADADPRWLDKAIQWADGCVLESPGAYSQKVQSLMRVRIAQHHAYREPDLTPILDMLDKHLESSAAMLDRQQIEMLVLKAHVLHVLERSKEAIRPLVRALTRAKTAGRVLVFLEHGSPIFELLRELVRRKIETDYARRLLAAFKARGCVGRLERPPRAKSVAQTALVEPLSERELQVLRLLKSTLTQREIADQLYLSVNTIRSHAKNIYAKLSVHSRIEAIARAKELDLL